MLIPSALGFMLKHNKHFLSGGTVVDLGDQLLYSRDHAAQLNPHLRNKLFDRSITDYQCVTEIYKSLGLANRICIDYSTNADIRLNLNHSALSNPEIQHIADLVTNQGFSEHVFNQYAVFECIHHLCKPGGFMLHVLPCQGWADGQGWGHGFFQYQPNFFRNLTSANNYTLIDIQVSPFSPSDQFYDFNPNLYSALASPHLLSDLQKEQLGIHKSQFVSLLVLLRKSHQATSFISPHE